MRANPYRALRMLLMAAAFVCSTAPAARSCAQFAPREFTLSPARSLLLHTVSEEPQNLHWYGAGIVLVEALGLALPIASVILHNVVDSTAVAYIGVVPGFGLLLLGSPLIHWAHGYGARGLVSLGVRLTVAGLVLAGLLASPSSYEEGLIRGLVVMGAGALGLIIMGFVDAFTAVEKVDRRWRMHLAALPLIESRSGTYGLNVCAVW